MRISITKNFASSYITWVNPRTLFFLLLQFRGLCSWDIKVTKRLPTTVGLIKQHASFVIFLNHFQCWHIGKSLQELRLVHISFFLFMKPWIVCSRQVLYHSAVSSAFFFSFFFKLWDRISLARLYRPWIWDPSATVPKCWHYSHAPLWLACIHFS